MNDISDISSLPFFSSGRFCVFTSSGKRASGLMRYAPMTTHVPPHITSGQSLKCYILSLWVIFSGLVTVSSGSGSFQPFSGRLRLRSYILPARRYLTTGALDSSAPCLLQCPMCIWVSLRRLVTILSCFSSLLYPCFFLRTS